MDSFRSADYRAPDGPYATSMNLTFLTTVQITALVTARQIGIGALYFDTTLQVFKLGYANSVQPIVIQSQGVPASFTTLGVTGASTLAATRITSLQSVKTDSSGTPGNVTNNAQHGRAAFAAAANTVVVTNSLVAATSSVFVQVGGADATLNSVRVTCAAGSFTVTGNAAATAATPFDFFVVQI